MEIKKFKRQYTIIFYTILLAKFCLINLIIFYLNILKIWRKFKKKKKNNINLIVKQIVFFLTLLIWMKLANLINQIFLFLNLKMLMVHKFKIKVLTKTLNLLLSHFNKEFQIKIKTNKKVSIQNLLCNYWNYYNFSAKDIIWTFKII